MTLREWVACRQAALSDVQRLARQLCEALGALHGRGVVHLNLRPDTIHVVSAEGDLGIQLGGLEFATLYDQPHPVPAPVDPYYAPPEAAGLALHPPGVGLCAWDWWSLGRVVQEMVLGRHVLGHVLQRDVSKAVVELRPQAEALLREDGAFPHRAGAVGAMPAMNRAVESLLRGLLASARDGRWGLKEIQRWLGRQPVKDHYLHPCNERFFSGRVARTGIHKVRAARLASMDVVVRDGAPETPADNAGTDLRPPNADWSFGDPRNLRIALDIPKPASMPAITVDQTVAATPDQVAFALVEGERQLLPYRRHTVKSLIAVRVSVATGMGLMRFDGRDGTVAERRVHVVKELPKNRTWFEMAGHQVVFLDEPR